MNFKSDNHRKAVFAGMANRFSLANRDILTGKRRADIAMLAKPEKSIKKITDLADDPKWIACKKYDGIRVMAVGNDGRVSLFNPRNGGEDISGKFPEVVDGLVDVFGEREPYIVDGEVISRVHDKEDFHSVVARINTDDDEDIRKAVDEKPVVYRVFDVLELDNIDLKTSPLSERKGILDDIIGNGTNTIQPEDCAYSDKLDFVNGYIDSGGEGAVFKNLDSKYEVNERSGMWRKYKIDEDETFIVYGFERGSGKNSDRVGSLLIGKVDGGKFVSKGKVGSGLTTKERKEIWDKYGGNGTDFITIPKSDWFGVDVKYMETDTKGALRHPRVERIREDLDLETLGGDL